MATSTELSEELIVAMGHPKHHLVIMAMDNSTIDVPMFPLIDQRYFIADLLKTYIYIYKHIISYSCRWFSNLFGDFPHDVPSLGQRQGIRRHGSPSIHHWDVVLSDTLGCRKDFFVVTYIYIYMYLSIYIYGYVYIYIYIHIYIYGYIYIYI